MPLIQIIIIAFALYALTRVVVRFRAGELAPGQVALWSACWIGVALVVAAPQAASRVASFVGVGRGADLAMYCAIIALFYLLFRTFVRIERVEREVTALVRELALRDAGLGPDVVSGTTQPDTQQPV